MAEDQPSGDDMFAEDPPREDAPAGPRFVVDVSGYEGPLDVLLDLARDQKVDLVHISILDLADQYLVFIAEARRRNLELAADYLVMAAWLAYLKSRLLLPDLETEEEPSGEEMAAALAFQLRRLEAMRDAGAKLLERPRVGRDVFGRGSPEEFDTVEKTVYDVTLYDLLRAYGDHQRRAKPEALHIEPFGLDSVEKALARLRNLLGHVPDWQDLWHFLPEDLKSGVQARSYVAATFAASLELAKEGRVHIRQDDTFGRIYLRPADRGGEA